MKDRSSALDKLLSDPLKLGMIRLDSVRLGAVLFAVSGCAPALKTTLPARSDPPLRALAATQSSLQNASPAAEKVDAQTNPSGLAVRALFLGEVIDLPRASNGKQYTIYVSYPWSYSAEPNRHYPVAYFLDGMWDFSLLAGLYSKVYSDERTPEYFTIAIGYTGFDPSDKVGLPIARCDDYSPAYGDGIGDGRLCGGKASTFLSVLQSEIVPFVEKRYRVDPSWRVLGGGSMGGDFVLYAMLAKPEFFQGFIAVGAGTDPVVWAEEQRFAASHKSLRGRLFVARGGADPNVSAARAIEQFIEHLKGRHYESFDIDYMKVSGEDHNSSEPAGYVRGLAFTFAPLAKRPIQK